MKKLSMKLSEEKIKSLGRAITDKSGLLYEAYLPSGYYEEINESQKQYKILQDSGVINVTPNNINLGSNFTAILKNLDHKSRNLNVAPDIELSKQSIGQSVLLAQLASDSFEDESEEIRHLADIRDIAISIAEYLGREMADIEYIINSDLNNTPNIKFKRIILEGLNKKIKLQLEKIEILSPQELHKLHGEYTDAAIILEEYLANSISRFNSEMGVHLDKILILIDKLKQEQDRKSKTLWLLRKALRNGQFAPDKTDLEYIDIEDSNLAYGGISIAENIHNVEISDDSYFLATVIEKLSPKKPKRKTDNLYSGEYHGGEKEYIKPPPSHEKVLVMKYMASNCELHHEKAVSLREYWELAELKHEIRYKAFLALFLKMVKSDFIEDRTIRTKDQSKFKFYLKSRTLSSTCSTRYVIDAKYIKFDKDDKPPLKEEIWKRY